MLATTHQEGLIRAALVVCLVHGRLEARFHPARAPTASQSGCGLLLRSRPTGRQTDAQGRQEQKT